jgi:uncharacterized membrane protein YhaH (DUF805 family)
MSWYLEALRKWSDFRGRASRRAYWMFVLVNVLIAFALAIFELVIKSQIPTYPRPISFLYTLVLLVPGIAAAVRRLHDTGRTGWWMLILIVPIIGALVLLFFLIQEGEGTDNAYGPDPKPLNA